MSTPRPLSISGTLALVLRERSDLAHIVVVDNQGNHTTYTRCCRCRRIIESLPDEGWRHVAPTALCSHPHPDRLNSTPHPH